MHFQQMHASGNLVDESHGSRKLQHHANPAVIDRMNSFCQFIGHGIRTDDRRGI